TRSPQGEIGWPENVFRADVSGERRDGVEPRGEETLALEHFRGLQRITLAGEAVMVELMVGPLHVEHAPAKRAFGEHDAKARVTQQHTGEGVERDNEDTGNRPRHRVQG